MPVIELQNISRSHSDAWIRSHFCVITAVNQRFKTVSLLKHQVKYSRPNQQGRRFSNFQVITEVPWSWVVPIHPSERSAADAIHIDALVASSVELVQHQLTKFRSPYTSLDIQYRADHAISTEPEDDSHLIWKDFTAMMSSSFMFQNETKFRFQFSQSFK